MSIDWRIVGLAGGGALIAAALAARRQDDELVPGGSFIAPHTYTSALTNPPVNRTGAESAFDFAYNPTDLASYMSVGGWGF